MKLEHSKLNLFITVIVFGTLFLVGLRSEENILITENELFWNGATNDTVAIFGTGTIERSEPISAKLSETEGKTLRELEELVQELGAKLKLAQEIHDQELRRIGAAKFPSQFGLAGKLDTLKDFSEIRWSPRTPSCQSRGFQGEWFSSTTDTTDLPFVTSDLQIITH